MYFVCDDHLSSVIRMKKGKNAPCGLGSAFFLLAQPEEMVRVLSIDVLIKKTQFQDTFLIRFFLAPQHFISS